MGGLVSTLSTVKPVYQANNYVLKIRQGCIEGGVNLEAIHAVNAVLWQPGEQTHVSPVADPGGDPRVPRIPPFSL